MPAQAEVLDLKQRLHQIETKMSKALDKAGRKGGRWENKFITITFCYCNFHMRCDFLDVLTITF
ncbi:hypothetical protein SCA6_012501 [Theobroma cacao]